MGRRPARKRRETILNAVTSAIASRGVRGMRLEDIAADAGVSVPLLYYHFENRLGLVRGAFHHAHEHAPSTGALASIATDRPAYETLEAALLAEIDEEAEVRDFSIVWGELIATAVFEPGVRADVSEVCRAWSADVARAIRAGIDDGSIDASVDPDSAADVLTILVDGICARWLAGVMDVDEARAALRAALDRELRGRGSLVPARDGAA